MERVSVISSGRSRGTCIGFNSRGHVARVDKARGSGDRRVSERVVFRQTFAGGLIDGVGSIEFDETGNVTTVDALIVETASIELQPILIPAESAIDIAKQAVTAHLEEGLLSFLGRR